jgi:hypothetical protein
MNARAGLAMMVTEIRTAGCDPLESGIVGLLAASGDSVHVQSDYSGDGAITTVEPSETVLYYYDAGLGAVMRDPGTGAQAIITDVTGCVFTYFDVNNVPIPLPIGPANRDLIRSIGITVTTNTDRGGLVTADTRVGLRNG